MPEPRPRPRLKVPLLAAVALAAVVLAIFVWRSRPRPLRVGLLHSRSGTMATSETSVMQATLLAIEELNARGGVLGRLIEPVLGDGRSDAATFGREAQRLIDEEHAQVLFGCWTSVCRKTIEPLLEARRVPLFYPLQYEGVESSPFIVYCGATPNQQILPAVDWSTEHLGRRVFLVGSDYIFPRVANQLIRDHLELLHATLLGEEYLPLGSTDVGAVVQKIAAARPDVILNTINGDTNIAFFKALRAAGLTAKSTPTVSFSLAEAELQQMDPADVVGDYAAWNYFQSLPTEANRSFVERFQRRYGANRVTDDPMEAGYFSVFLWAQAAEVAGSEDPPAVLSAVRAQSFAAPEGLVLVDPVNLHVWKTPRMGQIQADGQFQVLWSDRATRAVPFPLGRTQDEWLQYLRRLHAQWGNAWSGPVKR